MIAPKAERTNRLPRLGAGFVWEEPDAGMPVLRPDAAGVHAAFTTRRGGVSDGPFSSLNLSFSKGDEERNVIRNREIAGASIGLDGRWSRMRQVHEARVIEAKPFPEPGGDADAAWTDDRARTLAVLAADCVPVLLVGEGTIAVAHAGWRGAVAGVVQAAAKASGAGAAWLGPAIGPCCFEVSEEVVEVFRSAFGEDVAVGDRHVDLWGAAERAAVDAGVATVRAARLCTACHQDLFFSHRRDGGRSGRQGLVAALER